MDENKIKNFTLNLDLNILLHTVFALIIRTYGEKVVR